MGILKKKMAIAPNILVLTMTHWWSSTFKKISTNCHERSLLLQQDFSTGINQGLHGDWILGRKKWHAKIAVYDVQYAKWS